MFTFARSAVFFSLVFIVGVAAQADDPSITGAGVSNKSLEQELGHPTYQKFELTYFGEFVGPSLGAPNVPYQINPATSRTDVTLPQVLENQLKLNYNLTENFFVGPVVNFYLFPGASQYSVAQDSGLRIGSKNLLHGEGFSYAADLRFLAPLANTDIANNANVLLESLHILKYQVPHTKWAVSLLNFDKFHTYNNSGKGNLDYDLYVAPTAVWQFSHHVASTLFVEFYPAHVVGQEGWTTSQAADINPGISWDITDKININPGFVFYPSNLTLSATSTVVYISSKLL